MMYRVGVWVLGLAFGALALARLAVACAGPWPPVEWPARKQARLADPALPQTCWQWRDGGWRGGKCAWVPK